MNFGWIFWLLLVIPCNIVAANKEDIINTDIRKKWISERNFETVLELSFPFSRCCNVWLNGSTVTAENLFLQFTRVFRNDYYVREKKYHCQGYLLLGSSEEDLIYRIRRIPSRISTSEVLVVVDSPVFENSQLFNASLYGNANANLIAPSGLWSLSENFLDMRKFNEVRRYKDLVYNSRMVNFEGRQLQVGSFYNPPFCYLQKMINKTVGGIEKEYFLADNDSEKDGIEMQIFMLIAERLNFTWLIKPPAGGSRYGELINGTTWKGGVIEQMFNEETDIAFSGIWMSRKNYMFTNLSEPWTQLFIKFLVPRPKPYSSFWALSKPFSDKVWVCVLLIVLFQTFNMNVRAWLNPNSPERFRSFIVTLIELVGRLLGVWNPRNVRGARVTLHLWQCAGMLLVVAYSSSLASRLTGSEYEDRIDDLRRMVLAGLTWGREREAPPFDDYFDLSDPYGAQLPGRFRLEESDEDRHLRILQGNYAIAGRGVMKVFFPEGNVTNEDLKNFRVMKSATGQFYVCFAVQPWLLSHVNKIMLWLRESGITLFHIQDVIHRRINFGLREVLIEKDGIDGKFRVLTLTPLAAGFCLLLVGLLVASGVFLYELKSAEKLKLHRKK